MMARKLRTLYYNKYSLMYTVALKKCTADKFTLNHARKRKENCHWTTAKAFADLYRHKKLGFKGLNKYLLLDLFSTNATHRKKI
jgi:hypothetical protein